MEGWDRAFWYRPLDYKAAEADLNGQAAQGFKLAGVNLWGRAQWEAAQEPLQYAVILCEPNKRVDGQRVMEKVRHQLAGSPWKQAAAWGPMQVFESPKGTEPLFPNPLEELVFSWEQYLKPQRNSLWVMAGVFLGLAALSLALFNWRSLLASNMLAALLAFFPLGALYAWLETRLIRQYVKEARAAAEAGGALPVPGKEEARRRWRWQALWGAGLAFALLAVLWGDMGKADTAQAIWQLVGTVALGYTISLYHSRSPGRTPWYLVAGGITAVVLALNFLPLLQRERTPPTQAEAAALPVLSGMLGEDAFRLLRESGATPLGETYAYDEYQGGYQLSSVYCRAAFPALADRLFQEALHAFRNRTDTIYDYVSMRPCSLPGFDQAARGESGNSLALRRGLEVVWVRYNTECFTEAEILAAVEEQILGKG